MDHPLSLATPEELLEHDAFLRSLARRLVGDGSGADDVVQQAYVAALEHPPRRGGPLRAWLAGVVRNVAANFRRGAERRARHERAGAPRDPVPSADEVLAQEEARQRVVRAVLRLEEPARSTMLLRFFRQMEPGAIARHFGVPVETVRTRIKRALERLRLELDRDFGGDRGAWCVALLPFAKAAPAASLLVAGVVVMSAKAKLAAVLVLVGCVAATVVLLQGPRERAERRPAAPDRSASATPPPAAAAAADAAAATSRTLDEPARPATAAPDAAARATTGSVRVRASWQQDGSAAAGVVVTLIAWDGPHPQAFAQELAADAGGACTFPAVLPGHVSVFGDRGGAASLEVKAGAAQAIELSIPRGADLDGAVVDGAGHPVRAAELWISGDAYAAGHRVARTDAEGRFHVRDVTLPRLLSARAAGCEPSPFQYVNRDRGDLARLRLVVGRRGGAIRGRVTDAARRPVAGALVQVGDERRLAQVSTRGDLGPVKVVLQTRSDAAGDFAFDGTMAGDVPIAARAPDFAPWQGSVAVAPGGSADVAIELAEGATLEGEVARADGSVAAGAEVRVGAGDALASSRTRSRDDGRFRLEHIATGPFEAVVATEADGFVRAPFTSVDGATIHWRATLAAGPALRGRVLDAEEHPLLGCRVQAMAFGDEPGATSIRFTQTGADGAFVFENCPPRPHQVDVHPPQQGNTTTQMFQDVMPGGDELIVHVSHAQPASCFVAGIVADADGRPIGGAVVFAFPRIATGGGGHGERSDAETGRFAAGPLAPGQYSVHVMVSGRPPFDSAVFELAPDERRDLGTLRLPRVGTLRAVLSRSDDGPLDGVAVQVVASADGRRDACASDGGVATASLAPGRYGLRASGGGCAPALLPFEIRAGEETEVEVALAPAPEVVLVVAGLDAVLKRRPSSTPFAFTRIVDRDGVALAEGSLPAFADRRPEWRVCLAPGAYRLEVVAGRDVLGAASFTIPVESSSGDLEVTVR